VLLIGETGVGKSTWINAFANYCSCDSLEDAAKAGGYFPIPCIFTVTHPETQKQIIISSDDRPLSYEQIVNAGDSVTQCSNEYVFQIGNTNISLIDTPGLCDTRDAGTSTHDTDKRHVDDIFKLLSPYQEIHAIFILIKTNANRLSKTFQYTLTEIFKRLDKSACNNVIFIFTNAAGSNFKTGETRPVLQRFLTEKLSIALPIKELHIYCFENSTVQYLVECKHNIPHNEDDVKDAQRSWKRSVKSTQDLLGYLCSLEPHSLAVMMSINRASNMVSKTLCRACSKI